MYYDYCLQCGASLAPNIYKCQICGYDNSFDIDPNIPIDDEFLTDFNDTFNPEEESGY